MASKMAYSVSLIEVTRVDCDRLYRVSVDNGFLYLGAYPYVWLRDNCRCTLCYHPSSGQRASQMVDWDPDITPSSEELVDEGRVLRVTWPDQHRSDFQADWLNRQRFSDMERDVVSSPELRPFGGEMNGHIPTFDFAKVLHDDQELYNWLDTLNTVGLALVKGASTEKRVLRHLAERIAYLKKTSYGEEFEIFCKRKASHVAYTPTALGLHTDLCYTYYSPGVQMLHCRERTGVEGGENQFVDGSRVAEQIKEEFPESYKLLTTKKIDFFSASTDGNYTFHHKTQMPTIKLDEHGKLQHIYFSHTSRAPYMCLPVGEVTEVYRALKLFHDVMNRPENVVDHLLIPGEIVTFNNCRVLHGRSAFTMAGEGSRHLEGGYLDWDEVHSRMRVLREKLFGDRRL